MANDFASIVQRQNLLFFLKIEESAGYLLIILGTIGRGLIALNVK